MAIKMLLKPLDLNPVVGARWCGRHVGHAIVH
jgi:hypothetical protein